MTQAAGVRSLVETCLSRDALLKDRAIFGQVPPYYDNSRIKQILSLLHFCQEKSSHSSTRDPNLQTCTKLSTVHCTPLPADANHVAVFLLPDWGMKLAVTT